MEAGEKILNREHTTDNEHYKDSLRTDNTANILTSSIPGNRWPIFLLHKEIVSTPHIMMRLFEQSTVDAFFEKKYCTVASTMRAQTMDEIIVQVLVERVAGAEAESEGRRR